MDDLLKTIFTRKDEVGNMENSDIIYGRLTESVHISGYSLERAFDGLEWLLEEERWKSVGDGFDDINEFVDSLNLSKFKIAIDQRQGIVRKLSEIGASQRATARMLGVGKSTINTDVQNRTPEEKTDIEYQEDTNTDVQNRTLSEIRIPEIPHVS